MSLFSEVAVRLTPPLQALHEKVAADRARNTRTRLDRTNTSSTATSGSSLPATPTDEYPNYDVAIVQADEEDWRAHLPRVGRVLSDDEAAAYWAAKLPVAAASVESFHTACEHPVLE